MKSHRSARALRSGTQARTGGTPVPLIHHKRGQHFMEALEPRMFLTAFSWTAGEVYLTELVNRARFDPIAEWARTGIDVTAGLNSQELMRLGFQEPLALNPFLTIAARAHSLDMANRDFFDHENPDGLDPTDRAQAAGYMGTAGENIAAGYDSVDAVHEGWLESLGHRLNVLSLHADFDSGFHYDEFGPGFAYTNIGPFYDYFSEEFGVQSGTPDLFILGVIYNDASHDNFYSIGEGMSNVRIDVAPASSPQTTIGTYTTDAAGNYQIAVPSGSYVVRFTQLETGTQYSTTAAVGSINVKQDARAAQFAAPSDDYANAGDYPHAHPLGGDSNGNTYVTGTIEVTSDSDLFRYNAVQTAVTNILALDGSGVNLSFSVYSSSETLLGTSLDYGFGNGNDAFFSLVLVTGQTYYIAVASQNGATSGDYSLAVAPQLPTTYFAAVDARVSATSNSAGQLTAAVMNPSGGAVLFQQSAGGVWGGVQLVAASGSPTVDGQIVTWIDPKDGRTYAASRSNSGLLLYTNISGGIWTYRNLTVEIAGSEIPAEFSSLAALVGTDEIVRLAALLTNGDLVVFEQTGAGPSGGYGWSYANIGADLRTQGQSMPVFIGELTSYVTSWNGLNVAGLDASGDIRVVWWAPGLPLWQTSNLSDITGAPAISGGLSAYLTPWDGINLSGITPSGQLSVTWWVPGFGGEWRTNNLTQQFNGPTLTALSVSSFVTSWGGLNIAGLDTQGEVVVYWWAPALLDTGWQVANLSDQILNPPLPVGKLTGNATGTGVLSVFGASQAGHVLRYHWEIGGVWMAEDLTAAVGPG